MAKSNHFGPLAAAAGALVAGALLVLMLVLVDAQAARAAFQGANGNITYSHWDGNDWEIYTINANGVGSPFNVTNNNRHDGGPSYTKEYRHEIAYHGYDGHDDEIYRINRSGLGTRSQLTNNDTHDRFPDFAAGGLFIVYQCAVGGEDSEICEVHRSGTTSRQLTDNTRQDVYPVFSPDSRRVAYSSDDGNDYEIYTRDVFGGATVQVTNNDTNDQEPSWQPRP
jgi:hypothetical protein